MRPPQVGSVSYRDLDKLDSPDLFSTFDPGPNQSQFHQDYSYGSNDHDLVTLGSGDLLLLWAVGYKAPISPKPAWFDAAYRGGFGPGARGAIQVWRSQDGGASFKFVSVIDPARMEDGSGALPQGDPSTNPPGSASQPVYDMGGTDGPLAFVDPATDHVYVTFGCVGRKQDLNQKAHFALEPDYLNKTLVVASLDTGESWTSLGFIARMGWRFGMVPVGGGQLAFGGDAGWVGTPLPINIEKPDGLGGFDFSNVGLPAAIGRDWGYGSSGN